MQLSCIYQGDGMVTDNNNFFDRYGKRWAKGTDPLSIELWCFRNAKSPGQKAQHARNAVEMIWGHEDCSKQFLWTPWALRMLDQYCRNEYLGVAGCASSGKSDFGAVIAIIEFISAPLHTMVLVTSTSLKDSRKRIWGAIRDYWVAAQPFGLPGKLVDSHGIITYAEGDGKRSGDRSGIALIAADAKKEKESMAKLIGFKNKRVRLIADEHPELTPAILEAAQSNLSNNEDFKMMSMGNPASHYDPFGVFCKPKLGWESVTPDDEEWETELGFCIRFDGEKSPNILAGKNIYPWMITQSKLDAAKKNLGEKSLSYWRMFRGFWSPTGDEDSVYSEADIALTGADQKVTEWRKGSTPTKVAALDPSFTTGGDRCPLMFGLYGETEAGAWVLQPTRYTFLSEDVTEKNIPRTHQIVKQFKDKCIEEGVSPLYVGYDSTGAGSPFGDVVSSEWSSEPLRVHFGGAASDRVVSASDRTLCKERYANRVTELWFSGKELLRTRQLKGIPTEVAREMCARSYVTEKAGGLRVKVEPKEEMRKRTGESPDLADCFFVMIEMCRERLAFQSSELPKDWDKRSDRWDKRVKRLDIVSRSGHFLTRM